MAICLDEFFAFMDRYPERVPLDELERKLRELDITYDDVREYARFADDGYQRNLMHEGPGYHALVLCWKNGQRSPIHDHRGSSCGVRVLKGIATETLFTLGTDGLVSPTTTRELPEGAVCGSQDDDIHQVSNLQPGDADLVTLHVYSPPLYVMDTYSPTQAIRTEWTDPIFEFAAGAGI